VWVSQGALAQRQAAATDAAIELIAECGEESDLVIQAGTPAARQSLPVAFGRSPAAGQRAQRLGDLFEAEQLLRPDARFEPAERVNGVFAMTPDNLPFLGRHPVLDGVWAAQAIWITHATGAAALLTAAMLDGDPISDELAVSRFDGIDTTTLRSQALRMYRGIYARETN
jgi:glycine/D-amino acid oxidase-like deaminating enzyme